MSLGLYGPGPECCMRSMVGRLGARGGLEGMSVMVDGCLGCGLCLAIDFEVFLFREPRGRPLARPNVRGGFEEVGGERRVGERGRGLDGESWCGIV